MLLIAIFSGVGWDNEQKKRSKKWKEILKSCTNPLLNEICVGRGKPR